MSLVKQARIVSERGELAIGFAMQKRTIVRPRASSFDHDRADTPRLRRAETPTAGALDERRRPSAVVERARGALVEITESEPG